MEQKEDKLYYSIGEVAEQLGVAASLLRHWEKEFPEIKPKRNKKGNRFFTQNDLKLIESIHYLTKVKGYTLKGARERIKADRKIIDKQLSLRNSLLKMRETLQMMKNALD